jgi:hypothetical protein
MATYTWVDLTTPEANLLADLHGIVRDLRSAREFAEMVIEQFKTQPTSWRLVEPLSIAMTVTYSRAFSGGVRYHLQEDDLEGLSPEQRSVHQFLLDYRNKHVAHSVNAFEENIVRANYCMERVSSEGITGIGFGGGRVASLGGDKITGLIAIADHLESKIQTRIAQEEQRLLKIVRAMPLEEVLAGGQKAFQPAFAKVAQPRKALRAPRESKSKKDGGNAP